MMKKTAIVIVILAFAHVFTHAAQYYSLPEVEAETEWIQFDNVLNFGFSHQDVHVLIDSLTEADEILFIRNPYLKIQATFFDESGELIIENVELEQTRAFYPYVHLPSGTEKVILNLHTSGMLFVPVFSFSAEQLVYENNYQKTVIIIFAIFLLAGLMLSFFAYRYLGFDLYFVYSLYIVSLIITFFFITNASGYFTGLNGLWNEKLTFLSLTLQELAFLALSFWILSLQKRYRKLYLILIGILIVNGVISLIVTSQYGFVVHNTVPMILMFSTFAVAAYTYFRTRKKYLIYYLLGWFVYFTGASSIELFHWNILPYNTFVVISPYAGAFVEIIFFIVAIFVKTNDRLKELEELKLSKENKQYDFSPREEEVVELMLMGYTNKVIAENLFVSVNTVKFHLSNIYSKCGVNSKNEAIALLK